MAKKKKRGSSAPSAAIESEIEDVLFTILDECGALGSSNHENPWDQMALAVLGLANSLDKLALSEPFQAEQSSEKYQRRPSHTDNNNHQTILEVETAAQQVIRQCDSGSIEIQEQANRLFLLCNEADSVFHSDSVMKHLNKVKLQRVRIVMRSVACGIRQRTSLAETVVTEILSCLPHLYSVGTRHSSVVGKLRECGRLLQRRCIELEGLPWMEALELVAGMLPEHTTTDQVERPIFHHRAILSKDASEKRDDSPGTQQNSEPSTDISSFTSSNTILKAIHAFLHQDPLDPTTSKVTSLLLVGPEGSGKTVLCDHIEKLAADSVQGT
jgi:hypothetical protein